MCGGKKVKKKKCPGPELLRDLTVGKGCMRAERRGEGGGAMPCSKETWGAGVTPVFIWHLHI